MITTNNMTSSVNVACSSGRNSHEVLKQHFHQTRGIWNIGASGSAAVNNQRNEPSQSPITHLKALSTQADSGP